MTIFASSLGLLLATSVSAQAETVKHHFKDVIVQKPYEVEVCKKVQVPYGSKKEFDQNAAIIGGIVGGIIGNQIGGGSGKEAATGVGALTGAIIGGNKRTGPEGYRTETLCTMETRYTEEEKRIYSHSTVTFTDEGKSYTLTFQR